MAGLTHIAGRCILLGLEVSYPFIHITSMLTLIQFPWSPFCITIRHILKRQHAPFKLHNIAFHDRAPIITATKGAGYTVPCLVDGKRGICDVTDLGQEVARYVDQRFTLDLFPNEFEGIQVILSRYIECELEMVGFKVNDTYVIPKRPLVERTMLIRHKERKFGKGCVREWTAQRRSLCVRFADLLKPIDNMLSTSQFLLADRPLFVDYNLYGVLENYLFNGKTKLPRLKHLRRWHRAMTHAN
jgi:glutathione S-transferase